MLKYFLKVFLFSSNYLLFLKNLFFRAIRIKISSADSSPLISDDCDLLIISFSFSLPLLFQSPGFKQTLGLFLPLVSFLIWILLMYFWYFFLRLLKCIFFSYMYLMVFQSHTARYKFFSFAVKTFSQSVLKLHLQPHLLLFLFINTLIWSNVPDLNSARLILHA